MVSHHSKSRRRLSRESASNHGAISRTRFSAGQGQSSGHGDRIQAHEGPLCPPTLLHARTLPHKCALSNIPYNRLTVSYTPYRLHLFISSFTHLLKAIMQSVLLWHGRYRITEPRPEHISATCFIFKAVDEQTIDSETQQPVKVDTHHAFLIRFRHPIIYITDPSLPPLIYPITPTPTCLH